jgi:hypothetical protein
MHNQDDRNVVRWKTPFSVGVVLLLAAFGLQATPVCPTTGTFASLQALGSCTIAGETFNTFTYSDSASSGAVPVPASALTYTTIDEGPSAIGFLFGIALTAGPDTTNDVGIGYTVLGSDITDAQVTMAGLAVGSGSTASIAETVCPGSPIATCLASLALNTYVFPAPGPTKTSDNITFAPVSTLGVLKDVNVLGGTGGFASISLFSDTVSLGAVPEPGFYGVLAGGLAGVFLFAKRRKKTA